LQQRLAFVNRRAQPWPVPESIAKPRSPEPAQSLADRVNHVRRRQGAAALRTGLAIALVVILAWLATGMSLDWLLALPRAVRATFLVCGLGIAALLSWKAGIRERLSPPDDDSVALAIERAIPEFRGRFIASVQLTREQEGVSHSLVSALVSETAEVAAHSDFGKAVEVRAHDRWVRIAAVATVCAAGLALAGGRASWPLFQRAWLLNVPVPRKTMIIASTGDLAMAIGDDLPIEATATGSIPKTGRLIIESANGRRQDFSIEPTPADPSRFARTLQSVQEDFRYRIELGDNRTETSTVRVRPRPRVASLTCEQQWPAYTKIPPTRRQPDSLKLLAGSRLTVRLTATAPLRSAALRLTGLDPTTTVRSAPLAPDAAGVWSGTVEIPQKDVAGMTFQLIDSEGVVSRAMAVHRIDVVPDLPPTVRILAPARREELLTQKATLLLAFEAKDDFGVSKVLLHYAVNWTEGAPHRTVELDLGGEQPKVLFRRFEWKIANITPEPAENDTIDFWLEARDANDVTGPGIATMAEHWQARIVSAEEKRADLANRLNDTLQTLDSVRQNQEDLAQRLGETIHEKIAPPR